MTVSSNWAQITASSPVTYLENLWSTYLGNACTRIVGHSGVGKTVAAKAYSKRLKTLSFREEGLYVLLPPNCTPKGVYEEILKAIGHRYITGTTSYLRNRACNALSSRKVAVLMLDEANHLKKESLGEMQYLEEAEIVKSIVLLGTDRLDALIFQDEQVQRRYPRFYYDRVSTEELRDLVELWEAAVLRLPVASNLATMAKSFALIQSKTGMCIGKMDDLLRKAARKALIQGASKIEYELLDEVASRF